ncbi:hypothetical protein [Algoriphagus sp.]|uniref:hypothetical protein n=1 Tax=Algoriphagus sp. TaxID=1872435 RepID=UPI0027233AC3|nr:hypothetical protein [Algoriphagus sp.]MDO8969031.1 hypothetical protein [Algoriphagus sp.]MDP3198344.1 hypothetical protein [Algoriphagus sp.]
MKKKAYNKPVVVKTSAKTIKELQSIGASLKGKELFKEKVESAKRILASVKSLPV